MTAYGPGMTPHADDCECYVCNEEKVVKLRRNYGTKENPCYVPPPPDPKPPRPEGAEDFDPSLDWIHL